MREKLYPQLATGERKKHQPEFKTYLAYLANLAKIWRAKYDFLHQVFLACQSTDEQFWVFLKDRAPKVQDRKHSSVGLVYHPQMGSSMVFCLSMKQPSSRERTFMMLFHGLLKMFHVFFPALNQVFCPVFCTWCHQPKGKYKVSPAWTVTTCDHKNQRWSILRSEV